MAAPLYALTGKYTRFVSSEECQLAFEKLKENLTTSSILAITSDDGRYILDTDASETSIGAVLSQVQNGEDWVIAYASRTYNKAGRNYYTTRNELLAGVYFIRQIKQYLLGSRFLIRTDHAALTWLQRASELMGQQWRWQERLQDNTFDIEHRPGHKHDNADALSRRLCGPLECCMSRRNIVSARLEWLVEAIADTKRQERIYDLGWFFTSQPQDADI